MWYLTYTCMASTDKFYSFLDSASMTASTFCAFVMPFNFFFGIRVNLFSNSFSVIAIASARLVAFAYTFSSFRRRDLTCAIFSAFESSPDSSCVFNSSYSYFTLDLVLPFFPFKEFFESSLLKSTLDKSESSA